MKQVSSLSAARQRSAVETSGCASKSQVTRPHPSAQILARDSRAAAQPPHSLFCVRVYVRVTRARFCNGQMAATLFLTKRLAAWPIPCRRWEFCVLRARPFCVSDRVFHPVLLTAFAFWSLSSLYPFCRRTKELSQIDLAELDTWLKAPLVRGFIKELDVATNERAEEQITCSSFTIYGTPTDVNAGTSYATGMSPLLCSMCIPRSELLSWLF